MAYKLIIAGGRDFTNYALAEAEFLNYLQENNLSVKQIEIVSGGARGADAIGEEIARKFGLPCKQFPADWNLHGRSAGYKRNAQMAQYADGLLAFWDGKSRGTKHMIDLATQRSLKIKIVTY